MKKQFCDLGIMLDMEAAYYTMDEVCFANFLIKFSFLFLFKKFVRFSLVILL